MVGLIRVCLLILLAGAGVESLLADEPPRRWGRLATRDAQGSSKHDPALLAVVKPLTQTLASSTLTVFSGEDPVALGAVVAQDRIVTKASVLDEALSVERHDGRRLEARLLTVDRAFDMALLAVRTGSLAPLNWPEDESLEVGQVLVTGNHRGEPLSLGVVSVPARSLRRQAGRATLGVQVEEGDQAVRVSAVFAGMPAEVANLRKNDEIVAIDQVPVPNTRALTRLLTDYHPGDTLTLRVRREDALYQARLTLAGGAGNEERFAEFAGGPLSLRRSGFPWVFQHDGLVPASACGGPIIDLEGRVLGLNIARAGRTETYAIPASTAKAMVERLLNQAETVTVTTARPAAD